jgi:hypothetical protein
MDNETSARQTPKPEERKPSSNGRPAGEASKTPLARPPILASEALREEVAPWEPGRLSLRLWLAGLCVLVAASALLTRLRIVPSAPEQEHVAYAAAAIVLIAVLVPYRARGVLVAIAGLGLMVLGVSGRGPLAGLYAGEPTSIGAEVARVLAATVLPAALLFRAQYRAYRGARIALVVGLVLAIPAVVHAVLVVASGPMTARGTSLVAVLSVLVSCIGFMGSGTTAASTVWAVTVVAAFGLDIVARAIWFAETGSSRIAQIHSGLMFMTAAALISIGIFKILASLLAGDARRVDVLGKDDEGPPPSEAGEASD